MVLRTLLVKACFGFNIERVAILREVAKNGSSCDLWQQNRSKQNIDYHYVNVVKNWDHEASFHENSWKQSICPGNHFVCTFHTQVAGLTPWNQLITLCGSPVYY